MYLRNYIVTFLDPERVSVEDSTPVVNVSVRRIVDDELLQIEQRRVALDTVIYELPVELRLEHDISWAAVQDRLDELFVSFLESTSILRTLHTWFDLIRLLDPNTTTYHLVVSPQIKTQMINTGHLEEGIHGLGFPLYHHWFEIARQPHLNDQVCYVIPPEYYVIYLHERVSEGVFRIYASPFLNLMEQDFQPIRIQTQGVLDLLEVGTDSMYGEPNLSPIPPGPLVQSSRGMLQRRSEERATGDLKRCPVCGGSIQYLNEHDAFCLDCDWDNLKPIR